MKSIAGNGLGSDPKYAFDDLDCIAGSVLLAGNN